MLIQYHQLVDEALIKKNKGAQKARLEAKQQSRSKGSKGAQIY